PQLFVDANLILRKFSPPAMTHFDLSEKDIGKGINSVKDHIKYPTVIENIREVIETGEILEKEIQTTNGKWYQMNILPYKVRKENRTNGIIMTFVEITQRIAAVKDLEKLNAEHETLMFALSHDIKQPLSSLFLFEGALKHSFEQQDGEKFNKYLKRLRISIKTANTLIDDFVEAHRPSADWEKQVDRVNIESVVENVTIGLKSEHFTAENYECDFQNSEILFSRNNLRSIVYNLLNNAIKYRNPNRKIQMLITTKKLADFTLLQIQDNGIGIAKENQEKIFEKGKRLNSYTDGTGMGLYIIRRMLESMGGRITVESKFGEGSMFSVYFKQKSF
ncbi:MAG TPA: ATP-binding protein, partial [Salinimicrobium sp.]|nr:ATP-binding protein [Salinimicrobium sp.]